ncbi:MAG: pyruvate, phosphate dikinase [Proteobacteria bacterium]|nr:MAG: pyruvate, phosphate dikinase [Pseudomonadota bacterium]
MATDPLVDSGSFRFGTKAETLEQLQSRLTEAIIPAFHYFSKAQWHASPAAVLDTIAERFGTAMLAVRSSAILEDGAKESMAGAFLSKLRIAGSDSSAIAKAIHDVVESMAGDDRDQVIVQLMAEDIAVSGVIMTYDIVNGAPYYCIDYDDETGRTDIVTGGNGINKGLFVYRYADPKMIRSSRVAGFLKLARTVEGVCDCPALDIEFGLDRSGRMYLFQVRRIALAHSWHPATERRVKRQLKFVETFVKECSLRRHNVLGKRTILAVMPDWNPAEIIGTTPHPLAASLYRELITNGVWCDARSAMGYRSVGDAELMLLINNHPYIDVRNSFNSFIPAGLPDGIGEKLVNAWLDRLEEHPELHDKVEFEIVPTCLDFCFDEEFASRYPNLLNKSEFRAYGASLRSLTRDCLQLGPESTLNGALASSQMLRDLKLSSVENAVHAYLARAALLIRLCRQHGTLPFATVARHAFIAEALLRSAARRGAWSPNRLGEFKRSVRTITSNMVAEYALVCQGARDRGEFLSIYGHLRPGTYEIASRRYDERDDLFQGEASSPTPNDSPHFDLTAQERSSLQELLTSAGLNVLSADELLAYARRAIAGREEVKFIFTRALSDALSALTRWGEAQGLSRDDLSYIEWPAIVRSLYEPVMDEVDRHYLDLSEAGRRSIDAAYMFRIGHIVSGVRDIYVATLNRSVPNFIGSGAVAGNTVELTADSAATVDVTNRIVCIENADPGFDWIFTRNPSGLITRFGGANSHMAIRCAEFGLPAAIGCGDQIYLRVVAVGRVELDCGQKILRPLHGE